jgi:hypothetical protein
VQEYSDKWLNYRLDRLQILWNRIQEVCVKFQLMEVPGYAGWLKNEVGCDKAHNVKSFSKLSATDVMNYFLDLQVHVKADVQEPAIEADTGVVNQQLVHKLAYPNFTALGILH